MNLALNESIPRPCGDLEITLMDTLATLSREMATMTMGLCRPQDFSPEKFYYDGRKAIPACLGIVKPNTKINLEKLKLVNVWLARFY